MEILTSWKIRLAVEEARMPSLSSLFPTETPGASRGTMKAEMPEEGEGGMEGGREKRDEHMCRSFLLIERLILINTGSREGERKGGRKDRTFVLQVLISRSEHDRGTRLVGIGNPSLASIYDILIPFQHRGGGCSTSITTIPGLR